MNTFFQDLKYGVRMLLKKPGFTFVAVLTLAVGIGINTAVFSVVDAVMYRPLPFANPDRLVEIWAQDPDSQRSYPGLSREAFHEWRQQTNIFEQVEAYDTRTFTMIGAGEPETVPVPAVTPELFAFLGARPQLGRLFQPADGEPGNDRVVLIHDEMWKRAFGAAEDVIGKTVTLNDQPYTIVGVMPPGFKYPYGKFQMWVPLPLQPPAAEKRIRFQALARRRADVSLDQAQTAANTISQHLEKERPSQFGWGVKLTRLDDKRINSGPRRALLVLLAAVGFVLLLACVNVANLLLSRAASRRGEIAVRLALGARRRRIIRQLLTESVMLALLGGLGGVLLALWAVDLFSGYIPNALTFLSTHEIGLDRRVLLFSLAVSLLTGLLFGLIPAFRLSRPDLQQALKGTAKGASGDRVHNRLRGTLVIVEVALSLMLLIGAGLLIRSFLRLSNQSTGFEPRNLVAATLSLAPHRYASLAQEQDFFARLQDDLASQPGVEGITVAAGVPPRGGGITFNFQLEIEGQPPAPMDPNFILPYTHIDPNYFHVMRIPLQQGRSFTAEDTANTPPVVIINDIFARRYWGDEGAVGKRFRLGEKAKWLTVVGVVGDVKVEGLDNPFGDLEIYYPWSQETRRTLQRTLIVRTSHNPEATLPAIKSIIWSLDKDQPIYRINTVEQLFSDSLSEARFYLFLMSFFAAVAVLLVAMGIYSVVAYLVSQRTHEIGIRRALGAQAADVLLLVLRQGLLLIALGLVIGLVGAFVVTRWMKSLLFDISATDPLTFAALAVFLSIIALLACYVPARRATKVDPIVALRYE